MRTINIRIPEDSCVNCPYNREKVIDHNYYGEVSRTQECVIFNQPITDSQKRLASCCAADQDDIRRYADFLVEEINNLAEETYINAITDFASVLKPCASQPEIVDQIAQMLKERAKS